MKMKEAIAKLEADLQKYPYEVTLCFSSTCFNRDGVVTNVLKKKFADVFAAEEYAEACWKRNSRMFHYVKVIRRKDQMSILHFDTVHPHGYSKSWEMVMIENYKENYEAWFGYPCTLSDEEILQRLNKEYCPWDARPEDISEWTGI